jgi:hypothetical protein
MHIPLEAAVIGLVTVIAFVWLAMRLPTWFVRRNARKDKVPKDRDQRAEEPSSIRQRLRPDGRDR